MIGHHDEKRNDEQRLSDYVAKLIAFFEMLPDIENDEEANEFVTAANRKYCLDQIAIEQKILDEWNRKLTEELTKEKIDHSTILQLYSSRLNPQGLFHMMILYRQISPSTIMIKNQKQANPLCPMLFSSTIK